MPRSRKKLLGIDSYPVEGFDYQKVEENLAGEGPYDSAERAV